MTRILLWMVLVVSILGVDSMADDSKHKIAVFAGGCFWCMEPPFDKIDGVISTTSGYTAGHVDNPTYQQVSSGRSGHTEALKVVYDSDKVDFKQLLEVFWRNIDPVDAGGQFCDRGSQYRTGIYFQDEEQEKLANESKEKVAEKLNAKIATEIEEASIFYPAEDYHQDYYNTNPVRYKYYRFSCGRDKRLEELWDKRPLTFC